MTTRREQGITYEIENVGGVERVTLRLAPGVNILSGANGAGKTSAIRAIERAQGGSTPLERRDGTELGTVTGPGVTLRVGSVVTSTGDAELELADTGPLARLIDPGLKNTDAAARARVKALIELLGLAVDDDAMHTLCGDDESMLEWLREQVRVAAIDDLTVVAEQLRHGAHSRAREHEEKAAEAEAKAKAAADRSADILQRIPEGQISTVSSLDAAGARDSAIREHERAKGQRESRVELEAIQERIRTTIGKRPLLDVDEGLVAALESKREEVRELERRARLALEAADRELATVALQLATAEQDLEKTRKAAAIWDDQRAILDEHVTGPTAERMLELEALVSLSCQIADEARLSEEYQREREAKSEAQTRQQGAEERAEHYRKMAASIPARLGAILQRSGAPGLTVFDGRLHALSKDRLSSTSPIRDFETRCSTGERVALALDVAAAAYAGKVLPLDGEFWMSLDPENRKTFARLALERGLVVITEEPTGGELRVEQA